MAGGSGPRARASTAVPHTQLQRVSRALPRAGRSTFLQMDYFPGLGASAQDNVPSSKRTKN